MTLDISIVLGIIGTITGVISLFIHLRKTLQERPIIQINDVSISIEKKGTTILGTYSFNLNNTGDKPTTIYRIFMQLGPEPKWIEKYFTVPPHTSIRVPSTERISVSFENPTYYQLDDEYRYWFKEPEDLIIVVFTTHETIEKKFKIAQDNKWEFEEYHFEHYNSG